MLKRLFPVIAVFALSVAAAAERFNGLFVNGLSQEIGVIRLVLSTDDEPRRSMSRVSLRPGNEYRIGVQGAGAPLSIAFELATATYDFRELSGLQADDMFRLEVVHEGGSPRLRQYVDGEVVREVEGRETVYLTVQNQPNAIDKDELVGAKSLDEVAGLMKATVERRVKELGELKGLDLEAGPIWNNDHASERCPEVAEEWKGEHSEQARWSGHWTTTVPGEMSVCNCLTGTAGLADTLFTLDTGPLKALAFPVVWQDTHGVGRAVPLRDSAEGIGFSLIFKAPEDGAAGMVDDFLIAVRRDGFRPWRYNVEYYDKESLDVRLADGGNDADAASEAFVTAVSEAQDEKDLRQGGCLLVPEATYEKAAAGADTAAAPGVMLLFSPGIVEAVFVPDCSGMVY